MCSIVSPFFLKFILLYEICNVLSQLKAIELKKVIYSITLSSCKRDKMILMKTGPIAG